ncbi:nectin-1-like isoform X1 [Narcine bancroftii]|uniref:nectin-1-like isoform X1 n=1 Tax=Narcine bancroftii TaxID=1343680 RepID=UPI0038321DE9
MIHFCFQLFFSGALGVQTIAEEGLLVGRAGDEMSLPCSFAGTFMNLTLVQVTWLKKTDGGNVNLAVYNPQYGMSYPSRSSRVTMANSPTLSYTLTITPLQLSDQGLYNCEVNTFPDGKLEFLTDLTVLVKPLSKVAAVPAEAAPLEVPVANCTAANGKPAAGIAWIMGIPGNITNTRIDHADGTVTVHSQYKIIPSSSDDGRSMTCLVTHKAFAEVVNLTVTLSVSYPPEVIITGYNGNWYMKNTNHSLRCNAKANPPVTSYHWTISTGSIPPTVQNMGDHLIITLVDYSLNGTWTCEATNSIGRGRGEISIVVKEPDFATAGEPFGSTVIYLVVGILVAVLIAVVLLTLARKKVRQRVADSKEKVNSCQRKGSEFVVLATVSLKVMDCSHPSKRENCDPETTEHSETAMG